MKGYVVRGKDENGRDTMAAPDPAEDDRIDGHLPATDARFSTFTTIDDAEQARRDLVGWGCTDVRVYDADTGAVVPTYEEALARLAQLDAAPPLTPAGAMALWERAYRAAYAESGPGEPPPDERLSAMLAGHQAVLDAVASPAGSEARTAAMEAEIDYRVRRVVAQRAADKLAEMDALLAEAPTPDPAARAESGPMRFGDDWAGVFLRGDYAGPMAMYLRDAIDAGKRGASPDAVMLHALAGLASTLSGCDESGALDGLQQMRPFAACVALSASGLADPAPR